MSLPNLTLQTDKNNTSVDIDRITIRQSESGLVLIADLITATGEAYDLTDCSIAFGENKDGGKMVSDDNVDIIDAKNGRISYRLNTVVYQASGDAWFEITDTAHKLIDTTKSFNIDVIEDATIHINNDNYVSTLTALETHYKSIIQRAEDDNAALLAKFNQQINDAVDIGNTNIQKVIDATNQLIAKWNSQISNEHQAFVKLQNDWQAQTNQINSDYETQKKAIKSDADSQLADNKKAADAAIAKIESDKQEAITQANTDFKNKLESIQTDYDSWKTTTIADFQSQLNKLQLQLESDQKIQNDLKAAIDSAMAAVNKIQGVDYTKYAFKTDVELLSAKLDNFINKETKHFSDTFDEGVSYSKTHPDVIVFTP